MDLVGDQPVYVDTDEEYEEEEKCEEVVVTDDDLSKCEELKKKYSPTMICASANAFRKTGEFCDIKIKVDDAEYPAHKMILACFSPYFKAMFHGHFSDSNQSTISLKEIDSSITEALLNYIYNTEIESTKNNAQALLQAADFLQADALFELCFRFLEENMHVENCLSLWKLAELYSRSDLENKTLKYSLENFTEVCECIEFLELEPGDLVNLISNDSLNVDREEIVFDAVIRWMYFKEDERTENFDKILREVRLALMDIYYLNDRFLEEAALWKSTPCTRLLEEANKYSLFKNRRIELQSSVSRCRNNSPSVEAIYLNFRLRRDKTDTRIFLTGDGRCIKSEIDEKFNNRCIVCNFEVLIFKSHLKWECLSVPDYESSSMIPLEDVRTNIAWCQINNRWYAIGGLGAQDACNSVNRYDWAEGWTEVSPLPEAVFSAAAVSLAGSLYVLGGYINKLTPFGEMQIYNPWNDTWSRTPLPFPALYEPTACALNMRIYVCSKLTERAIDVYDASARKWYRCVDMNHDFVCGPVVLNGRIVVITQGEDDERFIEQYTPETNSWKAFATFPGLSPCNLKGPFLFSRNRARRTV